MTSVTRLLTACMCFLFHSISSRHRGDGAPWWQHGRTVKEWLGSERGCRSLTDWAGYVEGDSCLGNHPLQDAGVFPTSGDQVAVVVQEGNVGHVTAVTTVLVAWSLKVKHRKEFY